MPETQERRWHSSSLKAGRPRTQEKPVFQSKSKGRVRLTPQLNSQTGGVPYYFVFLSYSVFQLIGWDPPTLGRTCFTQSAASDVDLTQNNV